MAKESSYVLECTGGSSELSAFWVGQLYHGLMADFDKDDQDYTRHFSSDIPDEIWTRISSRLETNDTSRELGLSLMPFLIYIQGKRYAIPYIHATRHRLILTQTNT